MSGALRRADLAFAAAAAAILALHLVLFIGHAMWRDEMQAWMIAAASATPLDLWRAMRNEGHPALWHALLWIASCIWNDPRAMRALHLAIGLGLFAVVLARTPFTRLERLLLCAGYYLMFEYTVIARAYGLGMLLILLGITAVAWVLRLTVSWPWALCASSLLGVVLGGSLLTIGRGYLAQVEKLFADLVAGIGQQAAQKGAETVALTPPGASDIAGMFGLILAVTLVVCLIIARWWQAALYNPGGFRAEFHALRLDRVQALALLLLAFGFGAMGEGFRLWAWMPLVPLLFAGIALVHALAAARGRGGWLGLFYAALLVLAPLKQFVVVLAAMDSLLDIRGRWLKKPGG